MNSHALAKTVVCIYLLLAFSACDDEQVTDPITVPELGTLLVDRLAVSVVPTGQETVIVQSLAETGETIPFTAELHFSPPGLQLNFTTPNTSRRCSRRAPSTTSPW